MVHSTILASLLLALVCTVSFAQDGPNDTGALPDSAADGVENAIIPNPRVSIAEYLTNSGQHNILVALVGLVPNLTERLRAPGSRFTVLAPVDEGFRQLLRENNIQFNNDSQVIQELGSLVGFLQRVPGFPGVDGILQYHTIGRPAPYELLLENRTVATTLGQNLRFREFSIRDLDPSRPDSNVQQKNIFCTNGWIHTHSNVLLPLDLRAAVAEAASMPTPTITPGAMPTPTPTGTDTDSGSDTDTDTDTDTDGTDDGTDTDSEDVDATAEETPEPSEEDDSVCFPASSTVRLASGETVRMEQLEAGHHVTLTDGSSSPVFLFTHRMSAPARSMVRLVTKAGHAVTMTPNHYIYANGVLKAASAVKVGDVLNTVSGASPVSAVESVKESGLYAPHTVHGDLVVDGILVSGYSRTLHPRIAHALLAPVRAFVRMTGIKEPLGSVFYNGADRIASVLPRGAHEY